MSRFIRRHASSISLLMMVVILCLALKGNRTEIKVASFIVFGLSWVLVRGIVSRID